jgi:hypothetical protein
MLCFGVDGAHSERSQIVMNTVRALAVLGLIFGAVFGWKLAAGRDRPR